MAHHPRREPVAGSPGDLPAVSYVMPILNEAAHIRAAVDSMMEQDYAGDFEVVLALGPSTDGTTEVVREMARADPRITSVDNPTGSTPGGLNAAIRATRHPIVIRVDAHSLLPRDYTRIAVETLQATGADNVGGLMSAEGRTPFEKAVARAYGARVGLGGTAHHVGGKEGPAETAYLGAFRRERLVEVGLFDEGVRRGQDWELNRRLRQSGGLVWFTPRMKVTYRPRSTFRSSSASSSRPDCGAASSRDATRGRTPCGTSCRRSPSPGWPRGSSSAPRVSWAPRWGCRDCVASSARSWSPACTPASCW